MCNKCSICGVKNDADRYNDEVKNKQLESKLCFNCLFWVEKAENQSPHALIDDSFRHMHAKARASAFAANDAYALAAA